MAEILTDIDSLAIATLEVDENVKDYLDVAVILELLGVTKDTARRYGCDDIFNLAKAVFEAVKYYQLKDEASGVKRKSRLESIIEAIKLFAGGVTLSSPWLAVILAYMIFKVSLLPAQETPLASTSINLALVFSIINTSWISPIFMRKLFYFMYQRNYSAVRKILMVYFTFGFLVTILTAGISTTFVGILGIYPGWWSAYFLTFFIALSLLWLTTAPLYALRLYIPLIFTYISSLSVIGVLYDAMEMLQQRYMAHIYGIISGSFMAMIYLVIYLYLRSRFKPQIQEGVKVRFSFMLYLGIPYAIVNLLYFVFIFIDRLLVWYVQAPYPFLVDLFYEKPASLSLLTITVPFGVMNYYINKFYSSVSEGGGRFNSFQTDEYCRSVRRAYLKMHGVILASGILFQIILYYLLQGWLIKDEAWIFMYLSLGHVFLAVIISNILLFLYMHRPAKSIPPLLLGILINFILGVTFMRMWGVKYAAALGYMIASIVTAILLAAIALRTIIKNVDYYYYSAF